MNDKRNVKKKIKKNVKMNVRMTNKFKPILFLYQASFFGVRQIPEALWIVILRIML